MEYNKLALQLKKLDGRSPPAIILGCGSPNGLAFVRSLGQRGIPTIAISGSKGAAMRSRYSLNITHAGGTDPGEELFQILQFIGEHQPKKGVILPASDSYGLFLSRNREALSQVFHFVLSEESVLEQLADKKLQVKHAQSVGIPVPRTHSISTFEDLEALPADFEFPGILKPAYSHLWREYISNTSIRTWEKVLQVNSFDHLKDEFTKISKSGVEFLLQEKIEGGDDHLYALYAYSDRSSKPLVTFIRRKIRLWPVDFGIGSYTEGVVNRDVESLGVKLLTSIGYQGLSNTEFKMDPKDGQYKLIEVNIRCAGQTALAVDSGADIPYVAYMDGLDQTPDPSVPYKQGVRWINLASDYQSFRAGRKKRKLTWLSWAKSVLSARSHAYFSLRDPVPSIYVAAGVIKEHLSRRPA